MNILLRKFYLCWYDANQVKISCIKIQYIVIVIYEVNFHFFFIFVGYCPRCSYLWHKIFQIIDDKCECLQYFHHVSYKWIFASSYVSFSFINEGKIRKASNILSVSYFNSYFIFIRHVSNSIVIQATIENTISPSSLHRIDNICIRSFLEPIKFLYLKSTIG